MTTDANAPDWRQSDPAQEPPIQATNGHEAKSKSRAANGTFARSGRADSALRSGAFPLGKLPEGSSNLERAGSRLRSHLEDALLQAGRVIGPRECDLIALACRCEQAAGMARQWLTRHYDELKPGDRLQFLDRVVRFSEARSKAIDKLGLDVDRTSDLAGQLYGQPADFHDYRLPTYPPEGPENAPQSTIGTGDGLDPSESRSANCEHMNTFSTRGVK